MELICSFDDFIFNSGEKYYQCIIKDQEIPQSIKFEFSGQHLPKKYDPDVTFVEFRDCDCPKVPQGLTKIFSNLKVLGFSNSKLKELTKNDMAEYKNLERLICDKNEVDFLPGDLFDGFENLDYIKFTGNKLGVIEPDFLKGLDKLEYINFKSNPNIHKFAASNPVYERSINTTSNDIRWFLLSNFLNSDQTYIRNYAFKCQDSNKAINSLKELASGHDARLKLLDIRHDVFEEKRKKDVEDLKVADEKLKSRVAELEALNVVLSQEVKEMENARLNLSQQLEDYKKELDKEKDGNSRLKKKLQSQIDNLVQQFQSVMFDVRSK